MLLRERMRVVDVFRHWEGAVEAEGEGAITVEDFKAGLRVLGLEASRRERATCALWGWLSLSAMSAAKSSS